MARAPRLDMGADEIMKSSVACDAVLDSIGKESENICKMNLQTFTEHFFGLDERGSALQYVRYLLAIYEPNQTLLSLTGSSDHYRA